MDVSCKRTPPGISFKGILVLSTPFFISASFPYSSKRPPSLFSFWAFRAETTAVAMTDPRARRF